LESDVVNLLLLSAPQTPPDVYYVAKLAAMKTEDCGECLQLNIRFALEQGISKELVRAVINGGNNLPEDLKEVHDFVVAIATNDDCKAGKAV